MEFSTKTTTTYKIKCGSVIESYTTDADQVHIITREVGLFNVIGVQTQDLDELIKALQAIQGVIKK